MEYTLKELQARHSVRNYEPGPLADDIRKILRAEVSMINAHEAGLNFQIFFDDDDPFRGFTRSYGMFKNPRNYLCAVIDPSFPDAEERAGFFAQRFAMHALRLGIGSCFISGTFSPKHVNARMEVYERLPFIMCFGVPAGGSDTPLSRLMMKIVHGAKRTARDFFSGTDEQYALACEKFPWLPTALEGILCAPSAANRQPVRTGLVEDEGIYFIEAFSVNRSPIDLGIAKFNFQAPLEVSGEWEWGEHGKFIITE